MFAWLVKVLFPIIGIVTEYALPILLCLSMHFCIFDILKVGMTRRMTIKAIFTYKRK